jgi:hypothetical protein
MTSTPEINDVGFFTCPACGAHALEVSRRYTLVQHFEDTLVCDCGAVENGTATTRQRRVTSVRHEWGTLHADHHVTLAGRECADAQTVVLASDIFCPACHETAADAYFWAFAERDATAVGDTWAVQCGGCGCAYDLAQPEGV